MGQFGLKNVKNIYICSPFLKTGGPRSLHQLASMLRNEGFNTYLHYGNNEQEILYSDCECKVSCDIEDSFENLLIVPEYLVWKLNSYKNIRKMVWWLSLDFFFLGDLSFQAHSYLQKRGYPKFLYPIVRLYLRATVKKQHQNTLNNLEDAYHLYNCEYVRQFLKSKGIADDKTHYLCGPIDKEYFDTKRSLLTQSKKDLIAFNPAKVGKHFFNCVKRHVEKDSSIEFVSISGMTKQDVKKALSESKLYVDLGFFPGPERMPREAVALYCNILTSNIGSASNDKDVPIPLKNKFPISFFKVNAISKRIIEMVKNYQQEIDNFNDYRNKVRNQIERFPADIKDIFL